MKIIKERDWVEKTYYELLYQYKNESGSGFCFPCDENGNVFELNEAAQRNYELCKEGRMPNHTFKGVHEFVRTYKENAVGICDKCGKEVELHDAYCGACECLECGEWYNMAGQHLNPPEMWEEPIDYDY